MNDNIVNFIIINVIYYDIIEILGDLESIVC